MINSLKSTRTSISGIRPEMVFAHQIICDVYNSNGVACRVTCGTDSKHGSHSKHYIGLALDTGIKYINGEYYSKELQQKIAKELQEALGDDFDVVLEKTHIHIEFDPANYIA